jgi:hypothetical protein
MIGLCAVVVVWLSAGISIPLVRKHADFRPEVLLLVRSGLVLVALFFMGKINMKGSNRYVIAAGPAMAIASITFFQAVNVWGPNPVIIVITLTPLVNFAIGLGKNTRICPITLVCLVFVLVGECLALDITKQELNLTGLGLSVASTLATGLGLEFWGASKTESSQKMLWYSLSLFIFAIASLSVMPGKVEFIPQGVSLKTALFVFAIIGTFSGVVYVGAAGIALGRLPTTSASILLQGETPAVMLGSSFILGQEVFFHQGLGVGIMLVGISILMVWMARNATKST